MLLRVMLALILAGPAAAQSVPVPLDVFAARVATSIQTQGMAGVDASNSTVRAVTGGAPRSLAQRATETANVLDHGADKTGITDAAGALTAAAARGLTIQLPPGDYTFAAAPSPGVNGTMELTGTRLSGAGIVGLVNQAAFQSRIVKGWAKTTTAPGPEFSTVTTMQIGATGASGSYLKAAAYDITYAGDPSSYSGAGTAGDPYVVTSSRDAVGRLMQVISAPGNMRASMVAANVQAIFSAGSEGHGGGLEVDVFNGAGYQPLYDQYNTKVAAVIAAQGTADTTSAIMVANGGRAFSDAVTLRQNAVSRAAMRMIATGGQTDLWAISAAGGMTGMRVGASDILDAAFTTTTIAVGASTGTLTAATGTATIRHIGPMTVARLRIPITTNGTAGGYLYGDLPYAAAGDAHCFGRESATTGDQLTGFIVPGTNRVVIQRFDKTYPGASGAVLGVTCVFDATN